MIIGRILVFTILTYVLGTELAGFTPSVSYLVFALASNTAFELALRYYRKHKEETVGDSPKF